MIERLQQRYERSVFPRICELGLDRPQIHGARIRTLAPAQGDILEIGVGTGLNLPSYPIGVERISNLEPSDELHPQARRRAGEAGIEIEHIPGHAERMPLPDDSYDTVVAMFVLCSIPDLAGALREAARVLRPGGRLLFLEHVIETDGLTRSVQKIVEPVTRVINCGCSLIRDTGSAIEPNGFTIEHLEEEHLDQAPLLYRRIIAGVARPA